MSELSIIIPVYKESDTFEENVKFFKKYETIVIVDEPTEEFKKVIEKYKDKIKFVINEKRIGKVNALNLGASLAKGKYLVFLDADVKLEEDIFEKIKKALEEYEIVDVVKEVEASNFVGKGMHYEYLSYCIFNYICWKLFKKIFGINGSLIAVRRDVFEKLGGFKKVILEDVDFGFRARNFKWGYLKDVKIKIKPLKSFLKWLDQRKRWFFGIAKYYKDNLKEWLKCFYVYPLTLVMCPFIIPLVIMFLLPKKFWVSLALIMLGFLAMKYNPFIYLLIPASSLAILLKSVFILFFSFSFTAILFYFFAKKFNYEFKIQDFAIYFFIYAPLYFFLLVYILFFYYVFERRFKFEWKV